MMIRSWTLNDPGIPDCKRRWLTSPGRALIVLLTMLVVVGVPVSRFGTGMPLPLALPCQASDQSGRYQEGESAAKIDEQFVVGRVRSVTDAQVDQQLLQKTGMVSRHQLAEVEILEGPLKGRTATVANEVTDNPAYNIT